MKRLDGFDVVVVDGEGTFVTDGEHAWQIGGDVEEPSDPLQQAYVERTT